MIVPTPSLPSASDRVAGKAVLCQPSCARFIEDHLLHGKLCAPVADLDSTTLTVLNSLLACNAAVGN